MGLKHSIPIPKQCEISRSHFPFPATKQSPSEIECETWLPDTAAHGRLASLLSPHHLKTHCQHNLFFDGATNELSSRRAVLRIRFYNDEVDTRCVVSLKAKAVLIDGVSRVEEDEEELDLSVSRDCVRRAIDEFGIGEGGFRNVRGVYEWNGLKLELDGNGLRNLETWFGTCYEIECETVNPDDAIDYVIFSCFGSCFASLYCITKRLNLSFWRPSCIE